LELPWSGSGSGSGSGKLSIRGGMPMRGVAPQAVILASDTGSRLHPLNEDGVPKALLPVGNRPLISYPLAMIEGSSVRHVLVVCSGKQTAERVQSWIEASYDGDLHLEVRVIPENLGSADAMRAVADSLTADNVAVLSADVVSDVPLAAVLAAHTVRGAAATSLLHTRRVLASTETKPGKAPKNVDYIGLDEAESTLLFFASNPDARRDVALPLKALRRAGSVTVRTDLVDAHVYVFSRAALLAALDARPLHTSLKQDVVPWLVRHQHDQPQQPQLDGLRSDSLKLDAVGLSGPSARDFVADMTHAYRGPGATPRGRMEQVPRDVCAYKAGADCFCARANTTQAFGEINREVATPVLAERLLGPATNPRHENWLDPSVKPGAKSTIGAGCIIAAGCTVGDKNTLKRSVMGRSVHLGRDVKVINSVLMDGVRVGDGAHIQGSILCAGVRVEPHASLRDCQVGAGYLVAEGQDHRGEALAHYKEVRPPARPAGPSSAASDSSSS